MTTTDGWVYRVKCQWELTMIELVFNIVMLGVFGMLLGLLAVSVTWLIIGLRRTKGN